MPIFDVRPLQEDLPFGARIAGVTREILADEKAREELNRVFEERGVIVFEEVEPSSKMQVEISNVFGPLKDHPVKSVSRVDQDSMPGVIEISNTPTGGIVEVEGKPLMSWQPWHFDHSYNDELNRAGVLRSATVPPEGGLTGFADGIQIYNDLPVEVRKQLEDKRVIYTLNLEFDDQEFGLPKTFRNIRRKGPELLETARSMPRAIHPAVWTRKTGEKVVHISGYGSRGFEGMETREGMALARELWDEVEKAMRPYFHRWKETDMVIWDNWRMLHYACGCDPKYDRVMHRTTIKGDYGLGRFEDEPAGDSIFPKTA